MTRSDYLKYFLATCVALIFFSNLNTFAQTGIVGEELLRLQLTVSRGGKELTANQVPKLNSGDKLNIGIIDEEVGEGANFESRGYRGLVVIFLPTSKMGTIFEQRKFVLETRKLKTSNASINQRLRDGTLNENKNKGACFTKCSFDVPSYPSIPVIFLVSDENNPVARLINKGYKGDLKEFVVFSGINPGDGSKNINNYETLLDLGNNSLNLTVLPRKIQFLIDAEKVLQTEKANNTKVLQSLSERAFNYFDLGKNNKCDEEKGKDQKETVIKQFQCLGKPENFDVTKFANIKTKLNWKDISRELASEGVAALKAKFPSLNAYLLAAQVIIEIIEQIAKAQPLVISSSIATEDNLRPAVYNLYANPEMGTNEPVGAFSRAVFFVPFAKRAPESVVQPAEVAVLKPTPLIPCITPGVNNLSFGNSTYQENQVIKKIGKETALVKMKVKLTNAANEGENQLLDVSPESWQLQLDDNVLQNINSWERVSGRIVLDYNFQTMETQPFTVSLSKPQNWSLTNATKFRQGTNNSLDLKFDSSANCLEKIVFVGKDSTEPIEINLVNNDNGRWNIDQLNKNVKVFFNQDKLQKINNGEGEIKVYQYGFSEPILSSPLTLYPQVPRISFIKAFAGEKYAELTFANISDNQLQDIVRVNLAGNSMTFDPKTRRAYFNEPDRTLSQGDVMVSLVLRNGEETPQQVARVLPERLKLTNTVCPGDRSGEFIGAEWNENSNHSMFELAKCEVIPIDVSNFTVTLTPVNPSYNFAAGSRIVAKLENLNSETGRTEIFDQNGAVTITSRFPKEVKVNVNVLKLPSEISSGGWKLRLSLIDNSQESYFHTIFQDFIDLPQNPVVNCTLDGSKLCEISADGDTLNKVAAVFVGAAPAQESVWTTINQSKVRLPLPLNGESVWLKLATGKIVKLKNTRITRQASQ